MNLYVGNLAFDVTEDELRQEFIPFGNVISVNIVKDRSSGKPKGFAFVEMSTKAEGESAIAGLKGKTLKNRILDVSEARPRTENKGNFSRGNRGGYHRGTGGGHSDWKDRRRRY